MVVREVTPQPAGGVEPQELITDEQRVLWEKLGNPVLMSRELLKAVSGRWSTAEAAQEVFARLERLFVASLGVEEGRAPAGFGHGGED